MRGRQLSSSGRDSKESRLLCDSDAQGGNTCRSKLGEKRDANGTTTGGERG